MYLIQFYKHFRHLEDALDNEPDDAMRNTIRSWIMLLENEYDRLQTELVDMVDEIQADIDSFEQN